MYVLYNADIATPMLDQQNIEPYISYSGKTIGSAIAAAILRDRKR